jgi:hypothetical protein
MTKSRYATAGYASAPEPQDAAPTSAQQRLDQQNSAARWATWAQGVEDRLASLDVFHIAIMGAGDENEPGALVELIWQTRDAVHAETAETVKKIADALGARIEAEISVLRDEFVETLDKTLTAHSPKKLKEFAAVLDALKATLAAKGEATTGLLDKLAERIDATDTRRRYDRNTSRSERDELATKFGTLFGGMITRSDKRVEALAEELRELKATLRDAEVIAPEPLPLLPLLPSP